MPKIVFFITEDWAFLSHRLPLARAARDAGWKVVIATHVTTKAEVILSEGFELEPIPLDRGGANPWRELKALIALTRVLLRHKPEMDAMWRDVHARVDSLRHVMRGEIFTHLTPVQRDAYTRLMTAPEHQRQASDSARDTTSGGRH